MLTKVKVNSFDCHAATLAKADTACYLIYPQLAELNDEWLERMSQSHGINLVAVYVPADKWNDCLTPWPEPGEAPGCPPFAGKADEFLSLLIRDIIPKVDKAADLSGIKHRDLMGVSLGGLFTFWQWMTCSFFRNIACLSGSFWYIGFIEWFEKQPVPQKEGKAFFLLGEEEPLSHVKAYQSVGKNTETIVKRLEDSGIPTQFEWVPGNHFSRPVHRAEKALEALYQSS